MIGYLAAVDMEKQQISPAQVVIRHNRCPMIVIHLIGRARELRLKDLVVGIKNQPATVEAFIRPRAPPRYKAYLAAAPGGESPLR